MDTMPLKTVNTLLRVVIDQGYPLESALRQIGLDFNPLEHPGAQRETVPTSCYSRLYRLLMQILQDEAFGLGQAYHAPPGTFRMLCLFIIHCTTLEQALVRSREFHDYCDQYRNGASQCQNQPIQALGDGASVLCLFERSAPGESGQELIGHANILLMMYRFYSWLIGKELPLQAVWLRATPPADSRHYDELFGCPVLFGQKRSGLVIPAHVLTYPLVQNEDSLREYLRQAPYQLVRRERPGPSRGLSHQVEQLLAEYAGGGLPTAEVIAGRLSMSARTLHRKLGAEGTSLQTLKDKYRRELAEHYLGRADLTVDAIAALMGFQDNSAFYRSFKKWTGLSPGQYRARFKQGDADGG